MSAAADRLSDDVQCINKESIPFTLISDLGFHCNVWRSIGRVTRANEHVNLDFVLKVSKRRCDIRELRVLAKEYRSLRRQLDDIVPPARFVATTVNGHPGALVFAQTCDPWFDLANPTNEAEALPLLAQLPRAHAQLVHFVTVARRWLDEQRLMIDLVGADNLILDKRAGVRYVDSFHVFFYMDTFDAIPELDDGFTFRIEKSVQRLEYLEWLARNG